MPMRTMCLLTAVLLTAGRPLLADERKPLSFGPGQSIVDLTEVKWAPLKTEGVPPGPEIAVLRGDLKSGPVEVLLRLPAKYTFPNHSHMSDETYVWIKGPFTYVAEDGTAARLSGQTFVSLPGNVPHALICGKQPCLFYVRYSQTFDMTLHPMPKVKSAGSTKRK